MKYTLTLASFFIVALGLPARGLAQALPFDPIPSAPLTAALPLPVEPPFAPAEPGQRDVDAITRHIEDALQRVREQLPEWDARAIQRKFDESLKDVDWDALNKKIEDASKAFEARAPQIARLMQDAEKLQQQRQEELQKLQKKLKDQEVFKDVLKVRELGQRPFDGFARIAPRGYSAVLVLGDMQGGASVAENVPEAARKALADMKEFLPYKNYRLLDSAWILGTANSVSRLRGADDQVYQLSLDPSAYVFGSKQVGAGRLRVKLADLDETQARSAAQSDVDASMRRLAETQAKVVELRARLEAERARYGSNHPDVKATEAAVTKAGADLSAARVAVDTSAQTAGQPSGSSRSPIVDTSFDIAVGETVVVGTSRLRGDKALILLLTAVPQSSSNTVAPKGTTTPK